MATNNSANLAVTRNADGFDVAGGTTSRKMTVTSGDVTLTGGGGYTYTFPPVTDTLVSLTSTDTLTNKTLTSPKIGTGIYDTSGNELFLLTATASAVNELTYANAATGAAPSFTASGANTNIAVTIAGKGTGAINLGQATSEGIKLVASQPLLDANGNEEIKFVATGSAVNEITVTNAATTEAPSIASTGGDTNIALTVAGKGTGPINLGQATSDGVKLVADQSILDSSGNEFVKFSKAATAVNELTIGNGATGNGPTITASGETNVPITLAAKGTGAVLLGQATSTDVRLVADQPIGDSSGNELVKFSKAASAVNEITIGNAATTANPTITASGETNVALVLSGKGARGVAANNALWEKKATLTDGSGEIALDASLGTKFYLSAEGNRTIAAPTNAPTTGFTQKIVIEHYASGAARTLSLTGASNGFAYGSDITGLTETASGKTDYIGCIWDETSSKWAVTAYVKGY